MLFLAHQTRIIWFILLKICVYISGYGNYVIKGYRYFTLMADFRSLRGKFFLIFDLIQDDFRNML